MCTYIHISQIGFYCRGHSEQNDRYFSNDSKANLKKTDRKSEPKNENTRSALAA